MTIEDAGQFYGRVDAAIITIRKDEYDAVVDRLEDVRPAKARRHYSRGLLTTVSGQTLTICVHRLAEQGNGPAQSAAADIIQDLAPHLLAVVGIGGGVPSPEVTLGDVVLAIRLADVRVQALRPNELPQLELRGERVHKGLADLLANLLPKSVEGWSSPRAIRVPRPPVPLDESRFEGPDDWTRKVRASLQRHFGDKSPRTFPVFETGTIAASDFLVRDPLHLQHWLEASRKIQTVEMEAAGVFEAAAAVDASYPVLVARGTSDIVGYKREPEWTAYACHTAASFMVALLRSGLLATVRPYVPRLEPLTSVAPKPSEDTPSTTSSTHAVLRLTIDLKPVGGEEELRVWLAEVRENLAEHRTPLFQIEFEGEAAKSEALGTLAKRKSLTLEERRERVQLKNWLGYYTRLRQIVGRLLSLVVNGHLREWLVDSDHIEFIADALAVLVSGPTPHDPEVQQLCRIDGRLYALIGVNEAEMEEMWKSAGLPAKLFLETNEYPLSLLPYQLLRKKFLPVIMYYSLSNGSYDKDSNDWFEKNAKDVFKQDNSRFRVERRRCGN